ncbi:MAG: phenylalanine--tRNA ligase subunit beta [Thermodesulfovibrionia bacterium]|nr:phenylalanine--tRNA ligase subunit beta [Thermodesulfovibrionia bacterium]
MKASYNWLKEFVDFDISPEELAHAITMAGLEVEEIENIEGDTVFDIGITPNRQDCLSIRGIAREISTILGLPLKDVSVKIECEEGDGPEILIEEPDLCHRYSSRIITGVKPAPSPDWMVKRLEACGIRPLSNIVDVTNYVLLELGQPMHAFDLDKLSGSRIVVKRADDAHKFTTLDDEERLLHNEILLICDANKSVAVAGVMGGKNTEVSDSTSSILLESAYFKPSSIRRTSKRLNLLTESSYRFERGIDKEAVTLALDRAAQLISELAGGKVTKTTDIYPTQFKPEEISLTFEKINSLIGVDIDKAFVEKTLKSLGFDPKISGDVITVTPPSFRSDVSMDVDIIEEIARLYGYDNIPSTLPVMQMSSAPEHRSQEFVRSLKTSFAQSGYYEAINYSFLSPEIIEKIMLSSDDKRRALVYIKNPLRKEESAMRTTIVPALLNNVSVNLNRGEKMIRFFEISKIFLSSDDKLPKEILQLGAVFRKEKTASIYENRHEGFYDIKGLFENILTDLNLKNVSFEHGTTAPEPYLHPGKSCSIMIGNERVGSMGVLHPGVAKEFDIKGDITIAELYDLSMILDAIPSGITYKQMPKFPYVERDAALIVDDSTTVSDIRKVIMNVESDIIDSMTLFDVYKGKPIPNDKKSLAFAIRYRSSIKTLTDDEVDRLHSRIVDLIKSELDAELRS